MHEDLVTSVHALLETLRLERQKAKHAEGELADLRSKMDARSHEIEKLNVVIQQLKQRASEGNSHREQIGQALELIDQAIQRLAKLEGEHG